MFKLKRWFASSRQEIEPTMEERCPSGYRCGVRGFDCAVGQVRAICYVSVILAMVISFAGCGGDDNPLGRQPIHGIVTLDGGPLDSGSIRFECVEGKVISGAIIHNGSFEIPAKKGLPVGSYKVSISSPWRDPSLPPPTPENPGRPAVERVSPKFNINSTLKVEIHNGENELKFEVKSVAKS